MDSRVLGTALAAACLSSLATCRSTSRDDAEPRSDPPAAALAVADALYQSQEYDSAETRFRSALELAQRFGDPATEAAATLGLGRVAYRRDDNYSAARQLALDALALQQKHGLVEQLFESTLSSASSRTTRAVISSRSSSRPRPAISPKPQLTPPIF